MLGGDTDGKKLIQLQGSRTDNNATLFREGYQNAIADAGFETVAEEAVPDWDNVQAGVSRRCYLTGTALDTSTVPQGAVPS